MKISIGIIEDELIVAEDLKQIALKMGHDVSFLSPTVAKAKDELAKSLRPDMLFIDINLNGQEDGISLATFVNQKYRIPFLFITASTDRETVERASYTYPYGYILKPFSTEDIFSTLTMAIAKADLEERMDRRDIFFEGSFFVRDKNLMVKVQLDEVLYFEGDGNHVILYTTSRKFVIRKALKDVETFLPFGMFLRIHKSYIIRTSALTALDADFVYIEKIKLPIGRSYQNEFTALKDQGW